MRSSSERALVEWLTVRRSSGDAPQRWSDDDDLNSGSGSDGSTASHSASLSVAAAAIAEADSGAPGPGIPAPVLSATAAAGVDESQNASINGQLTIRRIALEAEVPADVGFVYCQCSLGKRGTRTEVLRVGRGGQILQWSQLLYFDVTSMTDIVLVSVFVASSERLTDSRLFAQARIDYSQGPRGNETVLRLPLAAVDSSGELSSACGTMEASIELTVLKRAVVPEDFELLKVVGRGNFGKVMLVVKKDTRAVYAMKVLRKDSVIQNDAVVHTMAERNVLRRVHHPFIVSLKYSFQTKNKLYMVLDYLSGGELFTHLSSVDYFSERRARFYAAQIVDAIGYLHKNHIIYRDLKPENILLDHDGYLCLTDFGLCKEDLPYGQKTKTFCGSPEYLSPEVLTGRSYDGGVDWWALGTFLYEMLSGLPPFYDEDPRVMNSKIMYAPLVFDESLITPEARSLIRGLLERDPARRLGCGPRGADDIKSHPFFRPIDWVKLYNRRIEAPFKPALQNEFDTSFFATEFTRELPMDSFVDAQIPDFMQREFEGFSYVATNEFVPSPAEHGSSDGSFHSERRRRLLARDSGNNTSSSTSPAAPSPLRGGVTPSKDD